MTTEPLGETETINPANLKKGRETAILTLAALGIVFGDIGTSPLYAVKACFSGFHAVPITPVTILGVLSLIFWSLTAVISIKYVTFIMRAHNQGEGGVFALFSLLPERLRKSHRPIILAALFGAALLYGDGFITPAISVLSALEGLTTVNPDAAGYVIPATCVVLAALFMVQRHGTERIGKVFGPVMLLWFGSLAVFGILGILHNPSVLQAVDPQNAVRFFMENGRQSAIVLGAVVLCVTGGEALYADMGHFGARPIRLAWFFLAMPALLLNYFGQGALLLASPGAAASPFYSLVPAMLRIPMIALSTCATIIASQAVISGVFSITRQAIQLGYLPRVHIMHTSENAEGQIYCPEANWLMAVVCILLVIGFRSSEHLAGAYGIAITSTMVITTALYFAYVISVRHWNILPAIALSLFFMLFDLSFFGANLLKLGGGGWIPLSVAVFICVIMLIWSRGRARIAETLTPNRIPLDEFFHRLEERQVIRTPGTVVALVATPHDTPVFLTHWVHLMRSLPEKVVLFSVVTENVPYVDSGKRVTIQVLKNGFHRLTARYGFAESPNVPVALLRAEAAGLTIGSDEILFMLGRQTLLSQGKARLWKIIYSIMDRNSMSPVIYFRIPPKSVIEVGMQLEL